MFMILRTMVLPARTLSTGYHLNVVRGSSSCLLDNEAKIILYLTPEFNFSIIYLFGIETAYRIQALVRI
jgi:hypothetical protein